MVLGIFGIGATEIILAMMCCGLPALALGITLVAVLAMPKNRDRPNP